MPLKGLHLELLRRDSFKFLEYEDKFGTDTLVKLYKVHYSGTKHYRLRSEEWSSALYFHGTAHCGCLNIRAQNSNEYNEPDEWKDNGETEDLDVFDEERQQVNESDEWRDDSEIEDSDVFDDEQQQADGAVSVKEEASTAVVGETRMTRIRIRAQDWCSGTFCQTKGILTCGHRRLLIQRGGNSKQHARDCCCYKRISFLKRTSIFFYYILPT